MDFWVSLCPGKHINMTIFVHMVNFDFFTSKIDDFNVKNRFHRQKGSFSPQFERLHALFKSPDRAESISGLHAVLENISICLQSPIWRFLIFSALKSMILTWKGASSVKMAFFHPDLSAKMAFSNFLTVQNRFLRAIPSEKTYQYVYNCPYRDFRFFHL